MTTPGVLKNWRIAAAILLGAIEAVSFLAFGSRSEYASIYTSVTVAEGNVVSTISSSGTFNPATETTVESQVSETIE